MSSDTRTRTIEWEDPHSLARAGRELRGADFLRAMAAGELPAPPICATMNMAIVEVAEGTVEFQCLPDESHYNPIGVVHGGLVCTLLDTVLGCAAHSTLEAGYGYTSIDISVDYLRPVTLDSGPLRAVGTVTKPGRRVIFATGEVTDAKGALVATARSSLLVMELTRLV
ncbi:PaaI family thioesterase [Humibacter soli]